MSLGWEPLLYTLVNINLSVLLIRIACVTLISVHNRYYMSNVLILIRVEKRLDLELSYIVGNT